MAIVVTREDLNPCTVKLSVSCDAETVKEGFNKAFKQAAKQIRIPGFRPGMAPKHLVEKQVDPRALYELAGDEIVRNNWKKAIEQENLEPYQSPVVDLKKLAQGGETDESGATLEPACEFEVKVPLKPVVNLGDYKSLQAQRPAVDLNDSEVDEQIEDMRRRRGKREAVTERGAENGDIAVVNIKIDKEEGDGRTFMTIVGQTFKELDEALGGMRAEDMKSLELKFPKTFQEADWAGKKHQCHVTLRSVSTHKMPELDDSFAKLFEADNLSELKNRLREIMLRNKQEQVQAFVQEQIMEDLVSKSEIVVPETMWEQVANQRLSDIAQEQQQEKKSIEDYVKERGMTVEEFVEAIKAEAKTFVVRAQAIQEIFQKEEMKIDNDDLNAELFLMAQEFGMQPKELAETLQRNKSLDELYHRAIHRKVMNFLVGHASISEGAAT